MKMKKITFLDDDDIPYDHLILNESQVRLLEYLYQRNEFYEGFSYVVERDDVEWKEI